MDHFSSKNNGVCPALKVPLFQPALLSVPSLIILSPTSTSFSEAQLNQSICGSCHETGFSTFFHIPCSIPACFSFHHHWQKNCFGAAGEVSSMTFNRNYITTSFPAGNTFPKTYLGLKLRATHTVHCQSTTNWVNWVPSIPSKPPRRQIKYPKDLPSQTS